MSDPLISEYVRLINAGREVSRVGLSAWDPKSHVTFVFTVGEVVDFPHGQPDIPAAYKKLYELRAFAKSKFQALLE